MKIPTFVTRKFRVIGLLSVLTLAILALGQISTHAATDAARVVKYAENDIVPVKAKLRFSTQLIILPEKEEILDFTTGDKEFWIINGAPTIPLLHPSRSGWNSQQLESHHSKWPCVFLPAH